MKQFILSLPVFWVVIYQRVVICPPGQANSTAGQKLELVDQSSCYYHPPWQLLRWRLSWQDVLLQLTLVEPACDLQNALIRRLGC